MNFPENLKYTKDHEWVRVEGDEAYVGVTFFAQSELGDIVFVDVEAIDEALEQEDAFGNIEAVKTVSDLFMPISGEILSFNIESEGAPETVNANPYSDGWMVKIKPSDRSQLESLLSADDYMSLVG